MTTTAYIITKESYCPFCEKAKSLLEIKGIKYTEETLGTQVSLENFNTMTGGARTVPQIWLIDEEGTKEYIGGADRLEQYFDENE